MPECSPSRAMFFEGRYPLRTNISNALLGLDLANSQLSPWEATLPNILRNANYSSGLFGKYHLGGPDNNPYGIGTPKAEGFDYFHGFLDGAPHPIDSTAGGVAGTVDANGTPNGPYACGFVPNKATDSANGANTGACYFADSRSCKMISVGDAPTPGRACLEQGGLFMPNQACQSTPPASLDFSRQNGYYVWQPIINQRTGNVESKIPLTDRRARTYSPTATTSAAIDWIKSQRSRPWMATVAYSSIHTPYQQAPQTLTPLSPDISGVNCSGSILATHLISDQMFTAMDTEIGRLLVETGVATRQGNGRFVYHPNASNTMVVIIGDNGTYGPSVKAPFDLSRAKATVYQTGVWVPLIVSGPLVQRPDRNVESMVNAADLLRLFSEIAGIDVRQAVPSSRTLDAVSMMPYLANPSQPALREFNFAQTGPNIKSVSTPPSPPCVIQLPPGGNIVSTCVQLFPQKAVCDLSNGIWYGPGSTSMAGRDIRPAVR